MLQKINISKEEKNFLKTRKFNYIVYNNDNRTITKRSKDKGKILSEIYWYLHLPEDLRTLVPRITDYNLSPENPYYSLEFFDLPTLANLYVLDKLDFNIWKDIISQLFKIIRAFQSHKGKFSKDDYHKMYYEKTIKRMSLLEEKKYWKFLANKNTLTINNVIYKNFNYFLPCIEAEINKLITHKDMCFIHGDFCLSNILYNPDEKQFKMIDPRGSFGNARLYGDNKYDIAKLRHSFSGYYDFIMHDAFLLSDQEFDFKFQVNLHENTKVISALFDKELEKHGYNKLQIMLIESLLFFSMIPLHNDNFKRQKAMYLTGIKLLNEAM